MKSNQSPKKPTNTLPTAWRAALLMGSMGAALALAPQGEVASTAAEAKPLKVGAQAPNSTLRSIGDKAVELKDVLKGKFTALIFYRGGWCPFCNRNLSDLAKVESDLRTMGVQLVAISPDTPEELNKTLNKDSLTYQLFSDSKAQAMKNFGVAFRVDDSTVSMYKDRFNIDLERSSGERHHILPVPSVFLIDQSAKIVFVYSNPDYKVRLSGEELLKAARKAFQSR